MGPTDLLVGGCCCTACVLGGGGDGVVLQELLDSVRRNTVYSLFQYVPKAKA